MNGRTRGLVLGKFAPLHRGHQHVIETAIGRCDEVVVLVYEALEVTEVPLRVRAGWVREIYPEVEVIEGRGAPEQTGEEPEVMRLQEDYILKTVPGKVTHFFSSEWYGAHVSAALGAEDVRVDERRDEHPVSGTAVRADPYGMRRFLHPSVYRDLVKKVVLLGAESTGKTTLARALAGEFGTAWVAEYGREFWEKHRDAEGRLTAEQLVELAVEHRRREDAAVLGADRFLFVDTNAVTTAVYNRHYHGRVSPGLLELVGEVAARYAVTFVCGDEIGYEDDGTRSGTEVRRRFQRETIEALDGLGIGFHPLGGTVESRVRQVRRVLWG